jgi:hypothetical protein
MRDTKSNIGKYTLLHYLVSMIEEKAPSLLTWAEEIPGLRAGVKGFRFEFVLLFCWSSFRLAENMSIISQETETMKSNVRMLQEEMKETTPDETFYKTMHEFLTVAIDETARLGDVVDIMMKTFAGVCMFFGEDPSVDVMTVLNEFNAMFLNALKENGEAKAHSKRVAAKVNEAKFFSPFFSFLLWWMLKDLAENESCKDEQEKGTGRKVSTSGQRSCRFAGQGLYREAKETAAGSKLPHQTRYSWR